MQRLITAALAAACAVLLSACATLPGDPGGSAIAQAHVPAIAAAEARVAGQLLEAVDAIKTGIASGHPPTQPEAAATLDSAAQYVSQVALARIAYDAVAGKSDTPAARRQIEAARATTDDAYRELVELLTPFAAV